MSDIKIIECPRDAMQGLSYFVPTEQKIEYLNLLLQAGFHTIDCGSFVSPKYIPQMRDTPEVLASLNRENSKTQLSVIVANTRGAREAAQTKAVDHVGFPFSISETFQQKNTNKNIAQSFESLKEMVEIVRLNGKEMVVYISMGFGNPYAEKWSEEIVSHWVERIAQLGVTYFSLSDTVGVSNPENISKLFSALIPRFPELEFGAHFHTRPESWFEKIDAAFKHGCRRFDGSLKGYGGCPMADDELVGNMPTERLFDYFEERSISTGILSDKLSVCMLKAGEIFRA